MASDIAIRSSDRGATVHSDVLTGHAARSVRGQIDRRTQVGVIADTPEWGLRNDRCPDFLSNPLAIFEGRLAFCPVARSYVRFGATAGGAQSLDKSPR
jgi:hypothetical protein